MFLELVFTGNNTLVYCQNAKSATSIGSEFFTFCTRNVYPFILNGTFESLWKTTLYIKGVERCLFLFCCFFKIIILLEMFFTVASSADPN